MISLYTWPTPNGRKPAILLEELGLDYEVVPVDITAGDQFQPEFQRLSPNGKIPAIVDRDAGGVDQPIFESGAILIYLAEKAGALLAPAGPARSDALSWLFWQVGSLGPTFGQFGHFSRATDRSEVAIDRFRQESVRLIGVANERLESNAYFAGPNYSIADIAIYPWMKAASAMVGHFFDNAPAVQAWMRRLEERPAVLKGMKVLESK